MQLNKLIRLAKSTADPALFRLSYPQRGEINRHTISLNGTVPTDAKPLNLDGLSIFQHDDTSSFFNIPELEHGLSDYLDGELKMGSSGIGNLPQNFTEEKLQEITCYIPPREDIPLKQMAKKERCKYFSSTSNISGPITQMYFLFSNFRRPCFDNIFEELDNTKISRSYMVSFRKPITLMLSRQSDNQYSIDSEKGFTTVQTNDVLLRLGHIAEYFLTTKKQTIQNFLASQSVKKIIQTPTDPAKEKQRKKKKQAQIDSGSKVNRNYYRHARINNNILLRSQIDCRAVNKEGMPIVFEIKTRACCPIRYDIQNFKDYLDYPVNKKRGEFESFEKEYYDLIRGGFIKYAFQLKIGKMDGAFIAYHNTDKIYGFEYVKMQQILYRLFGDEYNFDMAFSVSCRMLTEILDFLLKEHEALDCQDIKIGMYASGFTNSLIVTVEPFTKLKQYQQVNRADVTVEDYYNTFFPKHLPNPVYKYEFTFFKFMNGVHVKHPQIYYTRHDQIKMSWKVKKWGLILKEEYLEFLNEAYKQTFIYGNNRYQGLWRDTSPLK